MDARCACGRRYDATAWAMLDFCGCQYVPATVDAPAELFELRNCVCGSTLAVDIFTAALAAADADKDALEALGRAERDDDWTTVERLLGEIDARARRRRFGPPQEAKDAIETR